MTMIGQVPFPTFRQPRRVAGRFFAGLGIAVLGGLLEVILHPALPFARGSGAQTGEVLLFFLVLGLPLIGAFVCSLALRQLFDWGYPVLWLTPPAYLGERQRLRFLEAQAQALKVALGLASVGALVGVVWEEGLRSRSSLLVLLVAGLLHGLPTAILAWTEPDDTV